MQLCKVQAIRTSSKFFFLPFLHHSIEYELLMTKNHFLLKTNALFRSKNTKNVKEVLFFEKHKFFKNMHNFLPHPFLRLLKALFQIQQGEGEGGWVRVRVA